MAEDYRRWLWRQWGEECVANLKKHGFDAHHAENAAKALDCILPQTELCGSVGFGGSATIRALGLPELMLKKKKTVYDHWNPPEGMSDMDVRLAQGRADLYFCSANAVSMTGEIVNVDGVGNRNSAMCFGCPRVIIVAGMNKVVPDLHAALRRVKTVAAPMRARSLNMETPCAKTGVCADCNSPQRICRITTILHRRPMQTAVSVVLIHEDLGY